MIGSPLFILREDCKRDLMQVLERLAGIGFDGVEFLGLFGHSAGKIRSKLDSCGLRAVGDHVPYGEFSAETERVINDRLEMGCGYVTIAPPDGSGLPGGADYPRTVETLNRIGEAVSKAGMTLLFHNHAEELRQKVDGKTVLEHLLDDVPKNLALEADLGWMHIGGADPFYYLRKYGGRCPVVHFKDYMPDGEKFVFRPTGYGVMDNAGLYYETLRLNPRPKWYIMDHDDAYQRDSFEDLRLSLEYFRNLMKL
jgi:sugar phosphate isomerase/epimerase